MHIKKLVVKNFRLLYEVELLLESSTTVIVGRNNCGKTSLSDIIRRFLNDRATFQIEDFSNASYDGFCAALKARLEGKPDEEIRKLIPSIELRVHIEYKPDIPTFGPLSEFIIDVNDTCTEAIVVCRYALKEGSIKALFEGYEEITLERDPQEVSADVQLAYFKSLKDQIPRLFMSQFWAEDPNDSSNQKPVTQSAISLFLS